MWSDHTRIEEKSIALHQEIARRIHSNPTLVQKVVSRYKRPFWMCL